MLATADRRTLAAVVTHLSGDPHLVPPGCDRERLADIAVEVIEPYMTGAAHPEVPDEDLLHAAMEQAAGEPVDPDYCQLVREHMGFGGTERGEPEAADQLTAPPGFSVLIIGAGVTGILAGIMLARLGFHDFTIVERDDGPGGTWRQNTYPGCRVDTPSMLYSFSFEPGYVWPEHFSHQPALLDYVTHIVEKYEMARHIRYETSVEQLSWDESSKQWNVVLECADGRRDEMSVSFVIGAAGLLRIPKMPDIEGIESFAGESCHSSRWNADIDLAGKRVGIIGTGASANQIVPAVAPVTDTLVVFQRSPPWIIEHPQYGKLIEGTERTLIAEVPTYASWYRFRQFWTLGDRAFQMLRVDPDWPTPERSANAASDLFRSQMEQRIERKLSGRADLIEKVTPDYPPFGKRMLIDNGWYDALNADNVELNTSDIERICPQGVETDAGVVDLDVLIYATGFIADKVLFPIAVTGTGGDDVSERLEAQPEAYFGMAIAGCPNMLISPGPNGVPGHAGNGMFYAECQVAYIVECLRVMFDGDHSRMEVRPEAVSGFVEDIIGELEGLIWSRPGFTNWYTGSRDRVTAILPRTILDFWKSTRAVDLDAYAWGEPLREEPARQKQP